MPNDPAIVGTPSFPTSFPQNDPAISLVKPNKVEVKEEISKKSQAKQEPPPMPPKAIKKEDLVNKVEAKTNEKPEIKKPR